MSDIRDYQVDHLLLLVGSNPLPNAVAGKLLVATGGTITLIHSAASCSLAERLKSWLLSAGSSRTHIDLIEVKESQADSVYRGVDTVLKTYESAMKTSKVRVGLHYTGGTKVMSVHAYRALEDWARTRGNQRLERKIIFSYLDAQTLHMRFDGMPGQAEAAFFVGPEVEIGIGTLLELHGWAPGKTPLTAPVLPESAAALRAVHSNPSEARIWVEWLHQEFFPATRKHVLVPRPFWIFQSELELPGEYEVKQPAPNDKWKSNTELEMQTISWPNLPAFSETMRNELGQDSAERLILTMATGKGCKNATDFCKWLSGTWLESAVLSALQHCPQKLQLKECCMDLTPRIPGQSEAGFQFDVIAIRGYQLFAFSCTTEDGSGGGGRGLLKHKLFEASIRARQMGGDEACAALVCCMEQRKADALEQEVRRDFGLEGRIRVFGRDQLANLSEHIANWISAQSKEG